MVKGFARFNSAGCKRIVFSVFLFVAMFLLSTHQVFSAQATLTWTPPTTNTDGTPLTDLAGYYVFYGTASGSYSQVVNVGDIPAYTVTNLTSGTTYFFAATAYDIHGNESAFSNEVSTTVYNLPTLIINKIGSGTGTVTSSGINCGSVCTATYNSGTVITLSAVPNANSAFGGWSGGGCTGTGVCVTTMNTNETITSTFNILPSINTLPPVAALSGSPVSGSAPLYVSFTDSSSNSPTSWSWTFGDGGTSSLQNPSYTYMNAGTYTVTLTASNAGGSSTATMTNYITVSCPDMPVEIAGLTPQYFSSLQSAFSETVSGDVVQMQAGTLTDTPDLSNGATVTLEGGYNPCYTTNSGTYSTINGSLTISSGTLMVANVIIQ